ncbi:MAG: amino acid ABC transporter permease [Ruminococcaceae bacterium]|nr:amino acid ABC transporter permease [Oscillospiraceae bacterium]
MYRYADYKGNLAEQETYLSYSYSEDDPPAVTGGEFALVLKTYDELHSPKNEPSGGGYQIKEPTILSSAKKKGGAAGKRTATFGTVTKSLLDGFLTTVELFGLTLLFSLPIGLICSFASMSKVKPVKWFMKTFIWIIRGTPLMLQLIVVYYGPGLVGTWAARILTDLMTTGSPFITKLYELWPWLGLNFAELVINLLEWLSTWTTFDRFFAALLAFVINYSCYFSEIFRGGIESISKGQYEAGQVLGMTKIQVFFKVVLLQVVKRIIAPMSNEIMTLVKDTSLARTIAVYEVIWAGQRFIKSDGLLWPLFYTAVFYLIFCGLLTILFGKLEKKLDYFN